jgi:hypothetical protein
LVHPAGIRLDTVSDHDHDYVISNFISDDIISVLNVESERSNALEPAFGIVENAG